MEAAPFFAIVVLFIGLPWLVFHYITKWKTAPTLTSTDERVIEELYDLARRLDDRVRNVERIVTADNPNWREIACDAPESAIEDRNETLRRIK
jgi:phage shock protein B